MKINVNNASFSHSAGVTKQFPREKRPQVALSGRSNVGKSSLINTLLGRKALARVSSAPGKTVTVNFYDVDGKLYLVDLPGYGYAKRSKDSKRVWSTLTEEYFTKNPSPDAVRLVIQLIDVRTGPTEDDALMINWMIDAGIDFTVVATKADKLSRAQLDRALSELRDEYFGDAGIEIIPFSSVTKAGKDEVWRKIFDKISR